ncbi:MAG: walR [Bacilli bacterium]|nr:walR [Bacilli bacterium]
MKRILIIEDEILIAELERDYLIASGCTVDIEMDGKKGLELGLSGQYDLIILDLMLPKIDGFEICKQIRSKLNIPILVVSARQEDLYKITSLGFGADDYITKPFSTGELVARVNAHLLRYERFSRKVETKDELLQIRSLIIDRTPRKVYLKNKEVTFTTKEFDLLTFLAMNPNHVFSREHLFEKLWGWDTTGDHNTVTVHIRRLREKIEVDPSKPQFIETIWGAGYRFNI